MEAEGKRLKEIMDKYGNVNIFISEVNSMISAFPCALAGVIMSTPVSYSKMTHFGMEDMLLGESEWRESHL